MTRGPVQQPAWLTSTFDGEPVIGWRRNPRDHRDPTGFTVVTATGITELTADGLAMRASVLWSVDDERLS